MYEKMIKHLTTYKNTKISLGLLEAWADPQMTYVDFHHTLQVLQDNQILIPVRNHGTNGKNPPLPLTFRIRKAIITEPIKQDIKTSQLRFHPSIRLDSYFRSSQSKWTKDLPYIENVHDYLTHHGIPQEEATAPERSFHITGDEKWIDEKGGRKLLETIGVWERLKIATMPDPLMFAINPRKIQENQNLHRHLVVENKTTYYAILPILQWLPYTTLIYGAGWKVVSGIGNLPGQLGVGEEVSHHFEYFGDLDHEGLAIWYSLYQKCKAVPATALYCTLLQCEPSVGKREQRIKKEAIKSFAAFFSAEEKLHIPSILEKGEYLPQEAITAEALRDRLLGIAGGSGEEK
ncbi:hypothetical protein EDM59_20425 [Brevibacillus nitrificans]|uniref:Wadjet protein JetD C-terminal domain-containing protein n=1 Tax=Brevibacillus nitrificans TaxID=651560 RepID=A0A3M8D3P5_9BACL|nr:Wadjet anti-phage system protein JetD domain-containing protein [Brevibacillus nitrificans]RNB82523.1 hypothetical protein EDM59_20425 [Brevibacillus nitrificans]